MWPGSQWVVGFVICYVADVRNGEFTYMLYCTMYIHYTYTLHYTPLYTHCHNGNGILENSINFISYFQTSQDGRTNFLKVHAPEPVLERYADIINMQKPIKAKI